MSKVRYRLCRWHDIDGDLRGMPREDPEPGCRACRAEGRVSDEDAEHYDKGRGVFAHALKESEVAEAAELGIPYVGDEW